MVLLIADILPLPYLFMIATVIALMVNFPKMKDQQEELASHATAIISVVAMVMAAGVLTGIMSGTGMVDAMAAWLVDVIPNAMGPYMAVITGLLSIPMTFFMSNDAFYFGILPVLAETASHFGISAADMARASITGQPVHMQSLLVPAILPCSCPCPASNSATTTRRCCGGHSSSPSSCSPWVWPSASSESAERSNHD